MIHVPSEADEWGGRKYNHCLCINLMSLKGSYLETSYSLTTFCKYKCLSWAASPKAPGTNQMDEKNNLWGAGHLFSISCHRGFLQIALHCRYYRQCIRIHGQRLMPLSGAVEAHWGSSRARSGAKENDHHHTQLSMLGTEGWPKQNHPFAGPSFFLFSFEKGKPACRYWRHLSANHFSPVFQSQQADNRVWAAKYFVFQKQVVFSSLTSLLSCKQDIKCKSCKPLSLTSSALFI